MGIVLAAAPVKSAPGASALGSTYGTTEERQPRLSVRCEPMDSLRSSRRMSLLLDILPMCAQPLWSNGVVLSRDEPSQ